MDNVSLILALAFFAQQVAEYFFGALWHGLAMKAAGVLVGIVVTVLFWLLASVSPETLPFLKALTAYPWWGALILGLFVGLGSNLTDVVFKNFLPGLKLPPTAPPPNGPPGA